MQNSVLFDSVTLGPYTLRNRIVLPPAHTFSQLPAGKHPQ